MDKEGPQIVQDMEGPQNESIVLNVEAIASQPQPDLAQVPQYDVIHVVDEAPLGPTSSKVFSEWWKHYNKVTVDVKPKAECKYCKKNLVGYLSQGITHMKNHYYQCPKVKRPGDIKQPLLQENRNKDKFQLTPFNFSQENSRKELAKEIIRHEYPLSIVEHEGFRSYTMSLNPCFKMVCPNTINKILLAFMIQWSF
ncbi:unnamed protein product [Linum tenue]|uniref:BED-type domain-containing protein n=1 Tax=Linum tenue TaxID=586396 RepID=A0AAV0L8G1_9ROSI|nr:unnamed protein product [Linum tenue]